MNDEPQVLTPEEALRQVGDIASDMRGMHPAFDNIADITDAVQAAKRDDHAELVKALRAFLAPEILRNLSNVYLRSDQELMHAAIEGARAALAAVAEDA